MILYLLLILVVVLTESVHATAVASDRRDFGINGLRLSPIQSLPHRDNDDDNSNTIRVQVVFYGESQCPHCRKFVTEAWPTVWLDVEGLREYVDYDMIPWGNAYFATQECGHGPYSPDERACWYKKCKDQYTLTVKDDQNNDDGGNDCFTGRAVYQHGEKEGIVDIYETCIKVAYSLEDAVDFTYCAEGSIMDNEEINAEQLLTICTVSLPDVDAKAVQQCYEQRGKQLEIANAKQTPEHPGVPYVLLDGKPVDDPMEIQTAICNALQSKGLDPLPDSCGKNHIHFHESTNVF
ncbi:thiol reductase [Nitzschia inconspicua]|uniref:Thiol reductase n=1 Tax=Nitzschia inconspicua TaxID=303405 RepID=A0A9K3KXY7_9STRA|nr:thiol reductase [Nitzschia inconspicua]